VEQSEVEALVGELETRVERLRTLYEMYFMGIEKLEPMVPKKDVERRLAALRKIQIRNTGLRFRFQTAIQRFNTYQTYWLRISRQIEQGTYARDVRRAAARFGVDPAKERASAAPPAPGQARAPAEEAAESPVYELSEDDLSPESGDPALLEPVESFPEQDPFAQIASPTKAVPSPQRVRLAPAAMRFELDELAAPFQEDDPFPKPAAPAAPAAGPAIRIAKRAASLEPPAEGWPHDTERRIPLIAKRASIPDEMERAPASPAARPVLASAPASGVARTGGPIVARAPATPQAAPRAGAGPVAAPPKLTAPPAAAAAAAAPPPAGGPKLNAPPVVAAPAKPSAPVIAARAPVGQGPPSSRSGPASSASPASTPAGAAAAFGGLARPAAPAGAAKPIPAKPPVAAALPAAPAARPAAVAPGRPVPVVSVRPAPPAPKAPPPPTVGDMSGDRFGEVFSKYVETRQKHNEPTHAITRDALAKQLADSTQRLKQKHGGKAIDFEVVVKDGKTILRPVVK
jgi:hypothetical protein